MSAMRCIFGGHRTKTDYLVIWRIISFYGVAVCSHHLCLSLKDYFLLALYIHDGKGAFYQTALSHFFCAMIL